MGSKPMGYALIDRIYKELEGTIAVDMRPKFLGRYLMTIISPYAKAKNTKITN